MNQHNTMIWQLLKFVKRSDFAKVCEKHQSDRYCKKFNTWSQFVAMIFAQLTSQHGLRGICDCLNKETGALYHLGLKGNVSRSTISYANNNRPSAVFEDLYYLLLPQLKNSKLKTEAMRLKKSAKKIIAIDATVIRLCKTFYSWAPFEKDLAAVKINVKYDTQLTACTKALVMVGNESENGTLSKMDLAKNEIVTFDMGFYNFKQFNDLCKQKINFVTRAKKNMGYEIVKERETTHKNILADIEIKFSGKKVLRNVRAFCGL